MFKSVFSKLRSTHADRKRFRITTQILDFYCRLTSDPFNFFKFSKTFYQFKLVGQHILQNFFSCSVLLTFKTEKSRCVAESRQVCVDP